MNKSIWAEVAEWDGVVVERGGFDLDVDILLDRVQEICNGGDF